ncbi:MAG: 5-methyltetrahydropteroyltriglutamate--homocysteine methyltransferase [Alphaproteobacteria bacterium]|nr:5-methyltetrahydropteroyltriglutamate--homocysteine methyltransferase [Alphaproteobacteria bacterium]
MSLPLVPTALVGSYVQPDWLVDRAKLGGMAPPRVRAAELWRLPEDHLEEAQDAATLVAIRAMERAGLDILTDGELRRESYSNRFHAALDGLDLDQPATITGRAGRPIAVPRVIGPIRRRHAVQVRDVEFLRANTERTIKITLPGPFTLAQVSEDEHYGDDEAVAMAFAEVVRDEVADLFAAGADIVQLDEPWMQARPDRARRYAVAAINLALESAAGTTAVHMCFGYGYIVKDKPSGYSFLPELESCVADQISIEAAQPGLDLAILETLPSKTILVGVLDLGDHAVESAETVAERLRAALEVVPPERLIAAPDCGMKYLPHEAALGKLEALVAGAAMVRAELGG